MKLLRMIRRLAGEIIETSPRKAVASLVLMLALSATEGVSLLLLLPLLGLVGIEEPNSTPELAGWLNSMFRFLGMTPTLGAALIFFVVVSGLRALLIRWQVAVNTAVREDVTTSLRMRVYRAIAGAEWKFIVTRRPSEFVHVLGSEVARIGAAAYQVIDLVVATAVALLYLALAFQFSRVMTPIVLACAGLLAWVARGSLKKAKLVGRRATIARNDLHVAVTEHVASLKTAKSYDAINRHDRIFLELAEATRDVNLEVTKGQTELQQRLEFGSTLLLGLMVYIAYEKLGVNAAQLLVLLFIFARLMPRLVTVYRQVQSLAGALPVYETIGQIERDCLKAAEPVSTQQLGINLHNQISFDAVSFTYLSRTDKPAVRNVNLKIPAGLTTAIVGPSGAGKSTLADLLIGLLSPTTGRILIDDQPLNAERIDNWRKHIGYVPQDTFLFHDTVRANLSWANPAATEEQLLNALRLSAAHDFVMRLPNRLDTVIGERGVMVSGGERQRLSLARAVLRRPAVLVLDEATSSLDSENEMRIQQAIESLHQQLTIVVITHRLSTIRKADLIHVVDDGTVVESGSWTELVSRRGGRFRELCRAQGITDGLPETRIEIEVSKLQNKKA